MKRKNLVIVATLMLSMTAGCAGNTNPAAVQAAPAPVAETSMDETSETGTMEPKTTLAETTTAENGAQLQTNPAQMVMETAPGSISMEKAKSIAMNDAGVAGEAPSHSSAKLDWEDGRQVYEVDFFVNGIEYEYEILAADGSILKKKQDTEWGRNFGAANGATSESAPAEPLTLEQARQKAAERIPGVDPASIYVKEDYDHGHLKYEGEVYYNQTKYEFELDAETGTFTDWEEEAGH